MQIAALCFISMSELAKVMPITYEWCDNNQDELNKILYSLGMDIAEPIEFQDNIQHRNRFNEIVVCGRWAGYERTDKSWIHGGHASVEAKDKSLNNQLLNDMYRLKGMVE